MNEYMQQEAGERSEVEAIHSSASTPAPVFAYSGKIRDASIFDSEIKKQTK